VSFVLHFVVRFLSSSGVSSRTCLAERGATCGNALGGRRLWGVGFGTAAACRCQRPGAQFQKCNILRGQNAKFRVLGLVREICAATALLSRVWWRRVTRVAYKPVQTELLACHAAAPSATMQRRQESLAVWPKPGSRSTFSAAAGGGNGWGGSGGSPSPSRSASSSAAAAAAATASAVAVSISATGIPAPQSRCVTEVKQALQGAIHQDCAEVK
jgi:hypothetical protein